MMSGSLMVAGAFAQNPAERMRVQAEALRGENKDWIWKLTTQLKAPGRYIVQDIPTAHLGLKLGDKLQSHWPLFQNSTSPARIEKLDAQSFEMSAQPRFKSASPGRPRVELRVPASKLRQVPITAILSPIGKTQSLLWIDESDHVRKTEIYLLAMKGQDALILSDLPIGQSIVVNGIHRIRVGQKVQSVFLKELP
jgi:hypothetical protein